MSQNNTPAGGDEALSLENCAREPIHIPGSIQPHGALLCLDRLGRLCHASVNLTELLGLPLDFGRVLRPADFGGSEALHAFIYQVVADAAQEDVPAASQEVEIGGRTFDVVVHASGGLTICEFELRGQGADEAATFAHKAYRLMDALKRHRTIDRLLDAAVEAVRAITGFDRVMAYRFRHDDSGDVVAEARRDDLEAYLGRRYPATDIPAQARRLYVLNTLRLIADIHYTPVPLRAAATQTQPLDLSHSVLRSVSPIHVEYLRNMGVGASMSVSIVVAGKLWGMLACHHLAPLQVPYSVRMAADVMAQVLASSVQSITAQAREAAIARAAWLRTELTTRIAQDVGPLEALAECAPGLQENLGAQALVLTLDGKQRCFGAVDGAWVDALVAWLGTREESLVHVTDGNQLPPPVGEDAPRHCGLLALRFDGARAGWICALRVEQIETVRWGGKPEKEIAPGPLGPRLTPRGSFEEWRETVRGKAEPWSATELEIASQLLDAVSRTHAEKVFELDKLRSQLWAVLGHDLRNPLQSLTVASQVLDRTGGSARMNTIIRNSAGRMERLLRDVLDITRLQNGFSLDMQRQRIDLAALVHQLIEEVQTAHPEIVVSTQLPTTLMIDADPGRMAQLLSNLLSNARHHGDGVIDLVLAGQGADAVLRVGNPSPPIPADLEPTLFDPFKRKSFGNERNPGGMGLGLFIAAQIVSAHGGRIAYSADTGWVWFEVNLPGQAA
jgi:light-regulated signal transduction histidine kinase (bacteriophytochrome)